jgi:hypothetical protein
MEKHKGKQFDPNILEIFLKEKIYKLWFLNEKGSRDLMAEGW